MDIRRQTFKNAFKGYQTDEVNQFLDLVASRFEEIMKERDEAIGKTAGLQRELSKYEKLEQTLHEMLLNSQKTLEDAKAQAQAESKLIIREAEVRSDEIKRDAEKALKEIHDSLIILQEQKNAFIVKFRTLIKSQLDLLHLMEWEVHSPEKPAAPSEENKDHSIHLSSTHDLGA